MPTIKLRSHIGSNGILHLDIPSDFKEIANTLLVELLNPDLLQGFS